MNTVTIFFLFVGGIALFVIKLYNGLRSSSEGVKRGKSDLLGELKKRASLVNQLIEVCKGYGDHEKLSHITVASQMSSLSEAASVAQATNTVLERVQMMATSFPDLKADQTYLQLMNQLHQIEDELQNKRESYNREVETYNTLRSSFPQILLAHQLGFPEAPYFSTNEAGLDELAEFTTDDGRLLRERMSQLTHAAGSATKTITQSAADALERARLGNIKGTESDTAITEASRVESPAQPSDVEMIGSAGTPNLGGNDDRPR